MPTNPEINFFKQFDKRNDKKKGNTIITNKLNVIKIKKNINKRTRLTG